MLSVLPCVTTACKVHLVIGAAIVGGWLALMLWGLVAFIIKREPNPWFWRLLALLQGTARLHGQFGDGHGFQSKIKRTVVLFCSISGEGAMVRPDLERRY